MRFTRSTALAGAAALLVAGTAAAAAEKLHKREVALAEGGTVQIEYTGDAAPKVGVERASPQARIAYDPFAELDRIAFEMRARQQAMLQQMAAMQQAAARAGTAAPGSVTAAGAVPAGAHVSYFSSTTDSSGCTRTVQYSSDGTGEAPKVTHASAGSCYSAAASDAAPTPAAAPEPEPRKLDDQDV
ncbi:MAG TPA: hypothetical protein VI168_18595 [Croceibacterium sp.]